MENQFQQMTAETLAAACDLGDEFEAACAAMIRNLHAENQKLLTLLEDVEYALDYAADMTKPEGLSGCDCPICLTSIKVSAALAGKRNTP